MLVICEKNKRTRFAPWFPFQKLCSLTLIALFLLHPSCEAQNWFIISGLLYGCQEREGRNMEGRRRRRYRVRENDGGARRDRGSVATDEWCEWAEITQMEQKEDAQVFGDCLSEDLARRTMWLYKETEGGDSTKQGVRERGKRFGSRDRDVRLGVSTSGPP